MHFALIYSIFAVNGKIARACHCRGSGAHRHRRLDERPAQRADAAPRRLGRRHLRAGGERIVRPRRRHRRAGGADRAVARRWASHTDALGVAITTRKILDARGPRHATRSTARRCSPPGSASTGCCAMPFRPSTIIAAAGLPVSSRRGGVGRRAFPMARRSRPICWSAPTASRSTGAPAGAARGRAALCRLLRLARADRGERFPADVHRDLFEYMTFACRRASSFSAIRWRDRTTICGPAIAATTSCWYRPADETDQAAVAAHRRARRARTRFRSRRR